MVKSLKKGYIEHFDQRGSAYDRAMYRYPDARAQEFMQTIKSARLNAGMIVADVPAGGGYLWRYLPQGCTCWAHELCASFINHGAAAKNPVSLLPLPWPDESVDVAISLAGVHHIQDKRPFFFDLYRVVKSGGRLVVSDVAIGSRVAKFLDGYVGTHNSTGHEGTFLDQHTLDELQDAGWQVEECAAKAFNWIFPTREAMAGFCHELFDLRTSTVNETRDAIEATLGVTDLVDGRVGMHWELLTIVAVTHKEK